MRWARVGGVTEPDQPDAADDSQRETDDARRKRGLPPAPELPGQETERPEPPKPVRISFGLWVAAAIVLIGGFAFALTQKQATVDQLVELNNDPNIKPGQIASGVTALLWILLLGAVVLGVLFALFAYKAKEGTRSARTVVTVLGAVAIAFQLLVFRAALAPVQIVLVIAAVVLMYLPSVQSYYPKVPKNLS